MRKTIELLLALVTVAFAACSDEPSQREASSGNAASGNGNSSDGTSDKDRGATLEITEMPSTLVPATLWSETEDTEDYDTDQSVDINSEDYIESTSFGETIRVVWDGLSASVTGQVDGVTVSQSAGDVIVHSAAQGVRYVLSGTCSDGMFKVYSDYKY
ncbi:MAG: hypothetical protein IJ680_07280, partial [Paludibacteraceae bacterium]|nr:hypothetical protein [Paludibacteraceae bacterium]